MGVTGAAIATVTSRFVEMGIVVAWAHWNPKKNPWVRGAYRSLYIPGELLKHVAVKGILLMLNEGFWSLGMAVLNQSYSICGLDVTPALSITYTICNLTAVVFRSLGNTVGIITGQMLGSGCSKDEVRDANRKHSALCVFSGVVVGLITVVLAGTFPKVYNTTDEIRELARWFILICAAFMPFQAYIFPVYFTLRAGGKALTTFIFDSGAVWAMCIPLAFILSRFTSANVLLIFTVCNAVDAIRCVIGYFMIRHGGWIQNLTTK
jgi:Na+-driven multidrug efflux pump